MMKYELKKNMLLEHDGEIVRVLTILDERILLIDCMSMLRKRDRKTAVRELRKQYGYPCACRCGICLCAPERRKRALE